MILRFRLLIDPSALLYVDPNGEPMDTFQRTLADLILEKSDSLNETLKSIPGGESSHVYHIMSMHELEKWMGELDKVVVSHFESTVVSVALPEAGPYLSVTTDYSSTGVINIRVHCDVPASTSTSIH